LSSRRPATRAQTTPPPAEQGSDGHHNSVALGPRDRLVGRLYVEGDLHVAGTVEGALEATGDVEIDEGGKVNGPVTARKRLMVGSAGSLVGDVRVARLVIEDGATFSGNVQMGKSFESQPVVEAPPMPEPEPEPAKAEAPQPAVAETKPIELPIPKKKRR
jgi:cytoskeletal protein CcmA (bactofilin family)